MQVNKKKKKKQTIVGINIVKRHIKKIDLKVLGFKYVYIGQSQLCKTQCMLGNLNLCNILSLERVNLNTMEIIK